MHTLYSTLKRIICVATVMRQQHILNRDSRVTLHVLSSCMMYWLTASQEELRSGVEIGGGFLLVWLQCNSSVTLVLVLVCSDTELCALGVLIRRD